MSVGAQGFVLSSSAFQGGGRIPERFTCLSDDLSPALSWSAAPTATVSYVLILEDPDAPGGTFVHWMLYNLLAPSTMVPEGLPVDPELARAARVMVSTALDL